MAKQDGDALIVGGGVAGATAALSLATQGLKVHLIDQRRVEAQTEQDSRVVAISLGSERILTAAGAWSHLPADQLAPYTRMKVEAKGQSLMFRADEHGLPHLGTILSIPLLESALWQAMHATSNIHIHAPVNWHDFESSDSGVRLHLVDEKGDLDTTLTASMLVGADGAHSRIRLQAGIEETWWDYNQKALVGPVVTEKNNDGLAWQRFTELGPLALLPLPDGRSSVVWSIPNASADRLTDASSEALIQALNEAIEASGGLSPLGRVTSIVSPMWMPLKRQRAHALVKHRVVLVGDAGHAVHPLAGQGLNLGLADAAALAQCVGDAWHNNASLEQALNHYHRWRLSQSTVAAQGIHWINEIQRLPMGMGQWGLGISFRVADALWPLRQALIERASGIDRDSPKIAQG